MANAQDIMRRASIAGYVIGGAGLVALVTLGLFFLIGQPFGTINDLALVVTIGAIPLLILAFWELGGLTPTPLALAAQAGGWLAAAVWCVTQLLFVAGVVEIDYFAPATGAYAVESVALIVIGLWIAGANLLAGPWLSRLRWFGLVVGAGIVCYGIGTIVTGAEGILVYVGATAYLVLLPIWGLLMGRFLGRLDTPREVDAAPA
jgi:hypothetical protein